MRENNLKSKILKKLGQLAWLSIVVFILSLVAGTTIHIFAAFTEPAAAPSASDQDFLENILGANNADNDYDSSSVTSTSTGSIIERLEYIRANFSLNFPEQMYQVYDDWNCANNNEGGTSACGANDPEYTGEEGAWATSTDTDISNASTTSGLVVRDLRTGLYWSDAYDADGNGTENTTDNDFDILDDAGCAGSGSGTDCSDADINSGNCQASDYDCYDNDGDGSAIDFCENLSLDSDGDATDETDWRLPTQKELMQAYINGAANNLPNPAHGYWSSIEYYGVAGTAWYVHLGYGTTNGNDKTSTAYACCVRR